MSNICTLKLCHYYLYGPTFKVWPLSENKVICEYNIRKFKITKLEFHALMLRQSEFKTILKLDQAKQWVGISSKLYF